MNNVIPKLSVLLRLLLVAPIYIVALVLFVPYGIFRGLTESDIIRDYLDLFDEFLGKIYFHYFKKIVKDAFPTSKKNSPHGQIHTHRPHERHMV